MYCINSYYYCCCCSCCFSPISLVLVFLVSLHQNSMSLNWPSPDPPCFYSGVLATSQRKSLPFLPVVLAHEGQSFSRAHLWMGGEGWEQETVGLAAPCGLDLGRTPPCEGEASSDLLSSVLQLELSGQISRALLN